MAYSAELWLVEVNGDMLPREHYDRIVETVSGCGVV